MKKILSTVVVLFLVLSGLGAVALNDDTTPSIRNEQVIKMDAISISSPLIKNMKHG